MTKPIEKGLRKPLAVAPVIGSKSAQEQLETLAALYLGAKPQSFTGKSNEFAEYCLEQYRNGNSVE